MDNPSLRVLEDRIEYLQTILNAVDFFLSDEELTVMSDELVLLEKLTEHYIKNKTLLEKFQLENENVISNIKKFNECIAKGYVN